MITAFATSDTYSSAIATSKKEKIIKIIKLKDIQKNSINMKFLSRTNEKQEASKQENKKLKNASLRIILRKVMITAELLSENVAFQTHQCLGKLIGTKSLASNPRPSFSTTGDHLYLPSLQQKCAIFWLVLRYTILANSINCNTTVVFQNRS